MSKILKNITNCRICNSNKLIKVFSNKSMPIGESFVKYKSSDITQKRYKIDVLLCKKCGLAQLSQVICPKILYKNYLYHSKTSNDLYDHFFNFAEYLSSKFRIKKNELIIDIGSNNGIFLNFFKAKGCRIIGIEPSIKHANIANKNGIKTLNSFFNDQVVNLILKNKIKPKIITASNVIANIHDLNAVFKNIKKLLSDNSFFIFESFYLHDLIKNNVFDFIYHEHLSLFGIKPIQYLCNLHQLELFDVQNIKTKGGSLRFFIRNKNNNYISYRMKKLIKLEKYNNIYEKKIFLKFRKKIDKEKKLFHNELKKTILNNKNTRVIAFGASISCITLIYDYGIENKIEFLLDDNNLKHNLLSPGSNIQVLDPNNFVFTKNDLIIFLAWRFQNFFIKKYKKFFVKNHYKIFQLLPKFKIIKKI
jgi:SAM-dependent methyltransferase